MPSTAVAAPSSYSRINVSQLRAGATLRAPIFDSQDASNVLLLAKGTQLTVRFLERLNQRGIKRVLVHRDEVPRLVRRETVQADGRVHGEDRRETRRAARNVPPHKRVFPKANALGRKAFLREIESHEDPLYDRSDVDRFEEDSQQSLRHLNGLFECLGTRDNIHVDDFEEISAKALVNLAKDMDLFVSLGIKPETDMYPSRHSYQLAMLAMSLGATLGLSATELQDLGIGCLVHDAGMKYIDQSVVQADRKLSELEFIEITKHPKVTFDLLRDVRDLPNAARLVIYQLHERCNGLGYPRRSTKRQIHYFARIAAVADVFLALVSPRPYRPGMLPYYAAEQLVRETKAGLFDPDVVRGFLHTVSLFPLGSCVELDDGRVGKVLRTNGQHYTRPVVEVWRPGCLYEAPDIVDLSETRELSVRRALSNLMPVLSDSDLDNWD